MNGIFQNTLFCVFLHLFLRFYNVGIDNRLLIVKIIEIKKKHVIKYYY